METLHIIAKYYYTYGMGEKPNRIIEFSRKTEGDPHSLEAYIKGNLKGQWVVTTVLKGEDIQIENYSTTEKMNLLMAARQQSTLPTFDKKTITQFTVTQQDQILSSLEPHGSRKIEIENIPQSQNGLERVERMTIFDPS